MEIYSFDWMFFIQLIWFRARHVFKKFDQTKMFQILLYILPNLFDSTKLIRSIWLCISDDLSLVDWFSELRYFLFLKYLYLIL